MLTAMDLMSIDPVTVLPTDTISQLADILVDRQISAVPVVDKFGNLAGIVSEADLLHRAEIGTEAIPASWWLRFFKENATLAASYTKSHSVHVADIMTRKVITVDPAAEISEIADILDRNHIKRLPVLDDTRLIGMVGRTDIVRALARAGKIVVSNTMPPDDDHIRDGIMLALKRQSWIPAGVLDVQVREGKVIISGTYDNLEEKKAVEVLIENVPGVEAIEDRRVLLGMMFATV